MVHGLILIKLICYFLQWMNYSNKKNKNDIEELNSKIDIILSEIKKINEEQENFRIKLENLMKKEENNYNNLSSRFAIVENHSRKIFNNGNTSKQRMKLIKYTDSKHEEEIKISNLKQKFLSGKYNEALIDTKQNDKYLLNILPLIEKDIIPKIEIAILEDAISRINKRIGVNYNTQEEKEHRLKDRPKRGREYDIKKY